MALNSFLLLGAAVFVIGVFGALTRRNVVFIFMCLEVMFGGVGITLVALSRYLQPADPAGQVFVIFMLTVAAAETALGLGIFLALRRQKDTVAADEITELKG